jgi:hypothetical protein
MKDLYNNGECVQRWATEQMFTMKSEVVSQPSEVSYNLVQSVDQKCMKDGISQFQNFHVNFHKFHALFSTRLSQLG